MFASKEPSYFGEELLEQLIKQNNEMGDVEACHIIENKNLINIVNASGDTLLHFASKYHCVGVIKYLVEHGCDVNAQNSSGKTPIIVAVENQGRGYYSGNIYSWELVPKSIEMLCQLGANIYHIDNHGNCAAGLCLSSSDCFLFSIDKMLLQIIERDCENKSEKIAEKLLSLKTPLWRAVSLKNAEVIEQILKRKSYTVNGCHTDDYCRALKQAVSLMDSKIVDVFIKHGANLNIINNQDTSLFRLYALSDEKNQDPKLLKVLLNKISFKNDNSFMRYASSIFRHGTKESIQVLLDFNSSILNFKDSEGQSPLHYVVRNPQKKAIEAFQDRNFDVNARDNAGRTPLHLASSEKLISLLEVSEFLLNNGADVNTTSYNQIRPLFSWCENAYKKVFKKELKIIELFIEHDADIQYIGRNIATITKFMHRDPRPVQYTICEKNATVFDIILRKRTFYLAEPIIAHLAVLDELGKNITDHIRNKINAHVMFKNHFDLCKRRIKKMKNIMIGNEITLFKIVIDCKKQFGNWCTVSQDIIPQLEKWRKKCQTKYYYSAVIRKRIPNIIQKIRLIHKAAPILSNLLGLENNTSHVVVCKVIGYLDYEDLKVFSKL